MPRSSILKTSSETPRILVSLLNTRATLRRRPPGWPTRVCCRRPDRTFEGAFGKIVGLVVDAYFADQWKSCHLSLSSSRFALLGAGLALTLGCLVPGALANASASPDAVTATEELREWRIEREGIAVDLAVDAADETAGGPLLEGRHVRFRFSVTDATGQPLSGLYPAAWMVRLGADEVSRPRACVEKVEELVGGSILSQPELDLNVYYVLALNHDATVTVVDPLFGFGGTKLLAMIELPSPGEDWALTADDSTLLVSLPDSDRLAVADTLGFQLLDLIEVGPRPRRLALQPGGAFLWAALDGAGAGSGVAVVDVRARRLVARVATGHGPHDVAFSDDGRFAFVTNRGAGTLSVVDARSRTKIRDLVTGKAPVSVDFSSLAQAAFVAHEGDGAIVAVGGRGHGIVARMEAEPGLGQIRFAPGGRLGFAVNPRADVVHIVDAASGRIVQTGDMRRGPDQVAFSDELAYVRHRDSEIVLMIPLDEVGEEGARVPVVDFPGGERPFGHGRRPSLAGAVVQAPGANAVLVANPADQVIYYYKEGMAAPMGAFRNYDREPRAVLVVDRSLRERTRPGVYETAARLRRPGRYEVAFYLETPRIVHCFEAEVRPDPELEQERLAAMPVLVEPLFESGEVTAGEELRLRFRLTHPRTGEPAAGLRDVVVLAYTSGGWHQRRRAAEADDGVYEIPFVPPLPGSYVIVVECRSGRLPFHLSPQTALRAVAPGAGKSGRGGPT